MYEALTRQEELQSIFWDMYKDAYGFRPRGIDTSTWSEADFTEQFERLGQHIEREEALRKQREFKAEVDFEMRVQNLLGTGAKDRAMALRWIHEAEGTNGDDDYLAWTVGLPYSYFAVDKARV